MAPRKKPVPVKPPPRAIWLAADFIGRYGVVSEGITPPLSAQEVAMVAELAGVPMRRSAAGVMVDPILVREAFLDLACCSEHEGAPSGRLRRTADGWYSTCLACRGRDRGLDLAEVAA